MLEKTYTVMIQQLFYPYSFRNSRNTLTIYRAYNMTCFYNITRGKTK